MTTYLLTKSTGSRHSFGNLFDAIDALDVYLSPSKRFQMICKFEEGANQQTAFYGMKSATIEAMSAEYVAMMSAS